MSVPAASVDLSGWLSVCLSVCLFAYKCVDVSVALWLCVYSFLPYSLSCDYFKMLFYILSSVSLLFYSLFSLFLFFRFFCLLFVFLLFSFSFFAMPLTHSLSAWHSVLQSVRRSCTGFSRILFSGCVRVCVCVLPHLHSNSHLLSFILCYFQLSLIITLELN